MNARLIHNFNEDVRLDGCVKLTLTNGVVLYGERGMDVDETGDLFYFHEKSCGEYPTQWLWTIDKHDIVAYATR